MIHEIENIGLLRQKAFEIIEQEGPAGNRRRPNGQDWTITDICVLRDWMNKSIRYQRDPVTHGVRQELTGPTRLLQTRAEDCEDHAMLFGSLAQMLGAYCRLVVANGNGCHAFTELYVGHYDEVNIALIEAEVQAYHQYRSELLGIPVNAFIFSSGSGMPGDWSLDAREQAQCNGRRSYYRFDWTGVAHYQTQDGHVFVVADTLFGDYLGDLSSFIDKSYCAANPAGRQHRFWRDASYRYPARGDVLDRSMYNNVIAGPANGLGPRGASAQLQNLGAEIDLEELLGSMFPPVLSHEAQAALNELASLNVQRSAEQAMREAEAEERRRLAAETEARRQQSAEEARKREAKERREREQARIQLRKKRLSEHKPEHIKRSELEELDGFCSALIALAEPLSIEQRIVVLESIQQWQQRGFDTAWNEEYLDEAFVTVSIFELFSGLNQDQLFGKQDSLDTLIEVVHNSSLFSSLTRSKEALEPLLSTIQGLDELKRCTDCGRTHLKHSLVCPWCGSNPAVERKCPQCNKAVNEHYDFCTHCGASLRPTAKQSLAPTLSVIQPESASLCHAGHQSPMRKCPQCDALVVEGYSHCSTCGASLNPRPKINPCPSCSAEVPEGFIVCTSCGAIL